MEVINPLMPVMSSSQIDDINPQFIPRSSNSPPLFQNSNVAPIMWPVSPTAPSRKSPFQFIRPRSPNTYTQVSTSPEPHILSYPQLMPNVLSNCSLPEPVNGYQVAMTPRVKDLSVHLPQLVSIPSNPTPSYGPPGGTYSTNFDPSQGTQMASPCYPYPGLTSPQPSTLPQPCSFAPPSVRSSQNASIQPSSSQLNNVYKSMRSNLAGFLSKQTAPSTNAIFPTVKKNTYEEDLEKSLRNFALQEKKGNREEHRSVSSKEADILERIANDPFPIKGQACRHYEKGHCVFGVNCRFGHDESKQMGPDGRYLCRHWVKGFCQMGEECSFSHAVAIPQTNDGKYRCWHWRRGSCQMGEKCKFSHEGEPGEAPLEKERNSPVQEQTARRVCWHFRNGMCGMGDSCNFVHENEDGNSKAKESHDPTKFENTKEDKKDEEPKPDCLSKTTSSDGYVTDNIGETDSSSEQQYERYESDPWDESLFDTGKEKEAFVSVVGNGVSDTVSAAS